MLPKNPETDFLDCRTNSINTSFSWSCSWDKEDQEEATPPPVDTVDTVTTVATSDAKTMHRAQEVERMEDPAVTWKGQTFMSQHSIVSYEYEVDSNNIKRPKY